MKKKNKERFRVRAKEKGRQKKLEKARRGDARKRVDAALKRGVSKERRLHYQDVCRKNILDLTKAIVVLEDIVSLIDKNDFERESEAGQMIEKASLLESKEACRQILLRSKESLESLKKLNQDLLEGHFEGDVNLSRESLGSFRSTFSSLSGDFERIFMKIKSEAEKSNSYLEIMMGIKELGSLFQGTEDYEKIHQAILNLKSPDRKKQHSGLEVFGECNLVASKRYDDIHMKGDHCFSGRPINKPNQFAKDFIKRAGIGPKSRVLEIGCGMGRDSFAFAKAGAEVIAIDNSAYAIESFRGGLIKMAQKKPNLKAVAERIIIKKRDAIKTLQEGDMKNLNLTHIYGNSTLHYLPIELLKEYYQLLFSLLQEQRGYLGNAIKTVNSDSAHQSNHYRIANDEGMNLSIDRKDLILRVYPTTRQQIIDLMEEVGFAIESALIRKVPNFDRQGEKEEFCCVVARAA